MSIPRFVSAAMRRRCGHPHARPLHLLEVGVKWPPEAFLARKFEALAAAGVRVTVASSLVYDEHFALRGVDLLRMPPRGSRTIPMLAAGVALAARSPRRLMRLVRNVSRVPPALRRRHGGSLGLLSMCLPLARLRADVVQFEWNIAAVDHLPLFDVWSAPVMTSCRGSDLTVYPYLPRLRSYADHLPEVMRRAKLVHCVSESLRREAIGFGLEPAKARVIRPAVDPKVFRPEASGQRRTLPWRDGILRVLAVGDMRWEKGHEFGLQAIRLLVDCAVPVQFEMCGSISTHGIGTTPEEQRIRHTVADLGLEHHVSLSPRMTAPELSDRLARSDVLVHPSLAEGIPNVVLEAMACAVPVVTTNCGGVSEAVTDGVEGYLVVEREPSALAAALLALWRDPGLRRGMGQAGSRRVRSGFTLEAQTQEFLKMYREVVA